MKCCVCNKKIKLTEVSMKCKCSSNVCRSHRFPDKHNCSYDFKNEHKVRLKNELPHVEADKFLRI